MPGHVESVKVQEIVPPWYVSQPILADIIFRTSEEGEILRLIHLSLVCKDFQAAVQQIHTLKISSSSCVRIRNGCSVEEGDKRLAKLMLFLPEVKSLKLKDTEGLLGPRLRAMIPLKTFYAMFKNVQDTLEDLTISWDYLIAQHLGPISTLSALKSLAAAFHFPTKSVRVLQKCASLRTVTNVDIVVRPECDSRALPFFLDRFPNLSHLELTCPKEEVFTGSQELTIRHANLEDLSINLRMNLLTIDCPKLTALSFATNPRKKLIIQGANSLEEVLFFEDVFSVFSPSQTVKVDLDVQIVDGNSTIKHLHFGHGTCLNVIKSFLSICKSSLSCLVISASRHCLEIFLDEDFSELPNLASLSITDVSIDCQGLDVLENWLRACPSLKTLEIEARKKKVDIEILMNFIKKVRQWKAFYAWVDFKCPWDI